MVDETPSSNGDETELDEPRSGIGSWLGVLALLALVALVANVAVFDSALIAWLIFVGVLVGVAAVVAQLPIAVPERFAKWIALDGFILIPAVLGFFAWRADSTGVQWGLRYAIAVVIGLCGGALVGSGVFRGGDDGLRPRSTLMQFLHALRRGGDAMASVVGLVSAILVFPTVIISVVNVVLRRIGASQGRNLTSNALIEAQWYLYGLIFIFGLAYILREGVNVRVDFWFGERSSRTQSWIDIVGHCIGLLPLAYIGIKYSWPSVNLSWANSEQSPDAGGLYRPPIKTALMMAFVMLAIAGVADLIKNVEYLRGHELRKAEDQPALAGGQSYDVDEFDLDRSIVESADTGADSGASA